MAVSSNARPAEWREREAGGSFAGWLAPSRSEALRELAFAVIASAPAVAYPLVFGARFERDDFRLLLPTAVWALVALVFWCRAVLTLLPPVMFRVEGGRFSFGKGPIPALRTLSQPLGDVSSVRAASRKVKGKLIEYEVWDVVVEARDGRSHFVKLSSPSAAETAWIARRLASAVGLEPPDA
jgi:hypothetical protein